MDFKKIERILILAFFLLNLFLIYHIFVQRGNFAINNEPQEIDPIQEMQSNNIELPEFERDRQMRYYAQATKTNQLAQTESDDYPGYFDEEGGLYVEELSTPLDLSGQEDLTSADLDVINQFINSGRILNGDEYEYFTFLEDAHQIIYAQQVDGLAIADGTSSIRLNLNEAGDVISFEQNFSGIFSLQGEPKRLYSDEEAVKALFQRNLIPPNSQVQKPRLTYYRSLDLEDLSIYIPVWYIEIRTSNETFVERINALDLTTITESPASLQTSQDSQEEAEKLGEDENKE